MPISEKTRKVLWGRSGNRCALCRRELVIAATAKDDEAVVGDECHIKSSKPQGPRHDPAFSAEQLDEPENLILLCRVHHKMVDDQPETYTAAVLRELRTNHERWVASSLAAETQPPRVRVRRIEGNIPQHLVRITSGQELMGLTDGCDALSVEHDEPRTQAEVDLLSGFFQSVQDWGDLASGCEAGGRVKAVFGLAELLNEVEAGGFWVFGWREVRQLEGGAGPTLPFPVAILRAVRATNPEIIRVPPQAKESEPIETHDTNETPINRKESESEQGGHDEG